MAQNASLVGLCMGKASAGEVWRAMLGLRRGLAWPLPVLQPGPEELVAAWLGKKKSFAKNIVGSRAPGTPSTTWLSQPRTRAKRLSQASSIAGRMRRRWERRWVRWEGASSPSSRRPRPTLFNFTSKKAKARNLLCRH